MATIDISQDELHDFLDECDTDPYVAITAQLNSATSITGMLARAETLGYRTEAPRHWTERLEAELDAGVVPADGMTFLIDRL